MAVDPAGTAVGSVSGGCVEGAVYQTTSGVLAGGPAVVETYGISDETAFAVGLTCGGTLDVLVQQIDTREAALLTQLLDLLEQDEPVALATEVGGPAPLGALLVITPTGVAGSLGRDPHLARRCRVHRDGQGQGRPHQLDVRRQRVLRLGG